MRTQLLCGILLAASLLEAKIKILPTIGGSSNNPSQSGDSQCESTELPVSLKATSSKTSSNAAMVALMGNYSTVIDFKFAVLDAFLQGF